jgi:hypothetical protein
MWKNFEEMKGDFSGWFDEGMRNFCGGLQETIDDLPFLGESKKQYWIKQLEECASGAVESGETTNLAFRRRYNRLRDEFRLETQHELQEFPGRIS